MCISIPFILIHFSIISFSSISLTLRLFVLRTQQQTGVYAPTYSIRNRNPVSWIVFIGLESGGDLFSGAYFNLTRIQCVFVYDFCEYIIMRLGTGYGCFLLSSQVSMECLHFKIDFLSVALFLRFFFNFCLYVSLSMSILKVPRLHFAFFANEIPS